MAVSITWQENGNPITSLDWGTVANGGSADKTIQISHDGISEITNCALYIQPYTGSYSGQNDAQTDYDILIEWGNQATPQGLSVSEDQTNYTYFNSTQGTSQSPIEISSGTIAASASATVYLKLEIPSGSTFTGVHQFDLALRYTYTS